VIACTVAVLPLTASAQSNDAWYCASLSKIYRKTAPKHQDPSATVSVAMAKCTVGDAANGILALEQILKNQGVALPLSVGMIRFLQ
jgi:hypothetical protein